MTGPIIEACKVSKIFGRGPTREPRRLGPGHGPRVGAHDRLRHGLHHELGGHRGLGPAHGCGRRLRTCGRLGRGLYEAPVGFKWFVDGLLNGSLAFGCEESAGASFARIDGTVWTTDKDGIVPALLSAEITARSGRDPGELYRDLTRELGEPAADRVEAPATPMQKQRLAKLSRQQILITELAGEKIDGVLDRAPANDASIGGIKVVTANSWFAARPSGTEDIYKIYAESFRGEDHLRRILKEAQTIVDNALAGTT